MKAFPNPTAVPPDPLLKRIVLDVRAMGKELGPGPEPYYTQRGIDYQPVKAALLQACEDLADLTIRAIERDDASLEQAHFVASFMGGMLHAFAYGMEYQRRREADDATVRLAMDPVTARAVWHAIGGIVELIDHPGMDIPADAPLHGKRDQLVDAARRLDHEINHTGGGA